MKPIKNLAVLIIIFGMVRISAAQELPLVQGPVTALRADDDRLLIGQGPSLVEALITTDSVVAMRSTDLKRHDIRDIAVSQGLTFVLTEDGLTTLGSGAKVLDFAQGGGQRVAVKNGHVYIAAREAGIRVLKVDHAGKLIAVAQLSTGGPALDVMPDGENLLWAAEGSAGVELFDLHTPAAPRPLLQMNNLVPATTVRVAGTRLYVGYGNHFSILDTLNYDSPHLLSTSDLAGNNSGINDMLFQGNRVLVGRVQETGPDVVIFDTSIPKTVVEVAHFGEDGAGHRLALYGDSLFVGAGQQGLRRLRIGPNSLTELKLWQPANTVQSCDMLPPSAPKPPNFGTIPAGPITLSWKAACDPAAYEVRINGQALATVATPSYTLEVPTGVINWQITVIDKNGNRIEGPPWTADLIVEGWVATPAPPQLSRLYSPPLLDTRSPVAIVVLSCATLCAGLLMVVGAAWALGLRAMKRDQWL